MDSALKLLDALTKLLAVILWPGVVLFVLIRFGPGLKNFIANLAEFSIKAPGVDVSAKRKQDEAAAALNAAIQEKQPTEASWLAARDVVKAATPHLIRRAEGAIALWVDDHPENNTLERHALEVLGIRFILSKSTEQAVRELSRRKFDLVLSDMSRPGDAHAGYSLLDRMRSEGTSTPFIVYSGSRSPESVAEARRRGAEGCTNRPDELFTMALAALSRSS